MKILLSFLVIICFVPVAFSQNNPVAFKVSVPLEKCKSSSDIADYINSHYQGNDEKVYAIYSWLVNNIKYDADSLHYVILDEDNEERVTYALRRRKGVCENFAAIFNDLCTKCGIPSFAITGFTKEGGSVDRRGHVWCAAFVNNRWDLYDPTWDAGNLGNRIGNASYQYYKIAPGDFIQTHLPFDPLFQFLNYPLNYRDFVMGGAGSQNSKTYFNYLDTLEEYRKMDRLSQYLSEESRIKKMQWPASKIDTKLKTLSLQIEILNQDDDADLYNAAVDDYNSAISAFNVFIAYRNKQFQPAKSNAEVNNIFQNIKRLILSANLRLEKIGRSTATLQLNTGDIQKKINDLKSNLQVQESFYKNYTASAKNSE